MILCRSPFRIGKPSCVSGVEVKYTPQREQPNMFLCHSYYAVAILKKLIEREKCDVRALQANESAKQLIG